MKSRDEISRGWHAITIVLAIFEAIFLYEAVLADVAGYQRVFGVFVGLAVLSYGVLLYATSLVFYGWS